ncbi:MAG: phage holin family protein [Actinobacteria bacterium]|nr:phage holin family protein [Actinomycetota bacterium]
MTDKPMDRTPPPSEGPGSESSSARAGAVASGASSPNSPTGSATPTGSDTSTSRPEASGDGGAARPGAFSSFVSSRRSNKSAGQLMKEVSEDFSTLFRKEIELAKLELTESISAKAKGAAIIAIAAVFGFFALIFLLLGLRDGLDTFLWRWVADLITALILLLLGGVGAMMARRLLGTPIKTDMTKKTIREDVEWAKTLGKR